jgi:hypothetical protein
MRPAPCLRRYQKCLHAAAQKDHIDSIKDDFSKARTAKDGVKRGWNQTMAPLKQAKRQNASLPTDMRSKGGAKAATVAENAASGVESPRREGLGKYNTDDPTCDAAFAHEIEAELEDIASQEMQLAEHHISAVIRSYSRPTDPSDTSTGTEREAHSLSAEIHHLWCKNKPWNPILPLMHRMRVLRRQKMVALQPTTSISQSQNGRSNRLSQPNQELQSNG